LRSWVMAMSTGECRNLVWDHFTGDVICVDNGEVIDRIYDYGPVYEKPEVAERRLIELRRLYRRCSKDVRELQLKIKRHTRLLRLARSTTARGYLVDYDRLLGNGRLVLTVYSRRSLGVLEWFRRRGLLPVLDRIISVLSDLEPRAFSRTIRGRYMLAYMVYEMIRGRDPSYQQLDGLRGFISFTTFRRIKREAREIVAKHGSLLMGVIKNE